MTKTATLSRVPVTSEASFSLYLPPNHKLLLKGAPLADALTIIGPKGPLEIRKLRDAGLDKPVLFDGTGYKGTVLPPANSWAKVQRAAGADRVLLPGVFVPWDKDADDSLRQILKEQAAIAHDVDASLLLAIDARWMAKRAQLLTEVLTQAERPVAIVLAHRADPLSIGGAVTGLRWLASRVPDVSFLRSDHGSIGAVAFGARHASIGLTTTNRHYATAQMKPHRHAGRSARVFDRRLLDWFRASEIAGWSAAAAEIRCGLNCCGGQSLDRFLDEDLDATWHNMVAIADFADQIIGPVPEDRATAFLTECRAATARYGLAGFKGPENPRAQLTGWVLS